MAHLGIDEHRRGRARFAVDPQTGEYVLVADRWHTCFFDLAGERGLLGQVQGRTADDAAYWLAQAPPAWRDAIQSVCIDMCSIYAESLNRLAKPEARLAYGFRNPLNQRRRVRIACTRGYRRRSRTTTPRRAHPVTGRPPDPG